MQYRPEIDGLRAVAVLPVILFHAGFKTFSGGFVGVDVFFVISGFLITSIILNEELSHQFSIINFYERRARRILPALFFVMLVSLPFAWLWLIPSDLRDFSQSLVAVSVYISNILFWHESGYFDTAAELKPFLHTWSLAVEEQFYLLFPLILTLTMRRLDLHKVLGLIIIIAVSSLFFAQWGAYAIPTFSYYMLPTRAWELMLGALTAIYFTCYSTKYPINSASLAEVGSIVGLGMITSTVFIFDQHTPFPGLYALVPTLGTVLVILFASSQNIVGSFLSKNICVGIGLISYSAYLWHQPIFAFARHRSLVEPSSALYFLLCILSFVLAYLSWKYIESPFRNKKRFNRKQIFVYSAGFTLFFISIGIVGHMTNGFEQRFDPKLAKFAAPPSFFTGQAINCHRDGRDYAKLDESCVLGDNHHLIGALIGDSHANAISTQLGVDLKNQKIGLLQMTFNGCPSIQNVYRLDMDADSKCSQFNAEVLAYIKSHPDLEYVVMVSRWTRYLKNSGFSNGEGGEEYDDNILDIISHGVRERSPENIRVPKIQKKYEEAIRAFLEAGKKVILVYPIPEVGWRAPDFLTKQLMFNVQPIKTSTDYAIFKERNQIALDTLDGIGSHQNLIRIYPHKAFCDSFVVGRCVFELNGEPLYFDTNHVSNAGARLINQQIIHALESLQ